ncbi:cupin domain-containing protein [Stackebrandtia soli]|uniref:cupin domain-containing protein n=1 Tax=Stackebrandtia soli TaxID=1892856 RepID=UPI0039E95879
MTTIQGINIDDVEPVEVAPGIFRRRLTATDRARAWLIDFGPGTRWPDVDVHESEERYFVIDGEIVEGDTRYPAGSYVVLAKGSAHQPGSETGGRMLGITIFEP